MKSSLSFLMTLSAFFLLSFSLHAEEIKKDHVDQMIDQMVAQGIIPKGDAAKAKEKLKNISNEEWEGINKQAKVMAEKYQGQNRDVSNTPNDAINNINFDSAMFKDVQGRVNGQLTNKNE